MSHFVISPAMPRKQYKSAFSGVRFASSEAVVRIKLLLEGSFGEAGNYRILVVSLAWRNSQQRIGFQRINEPWLLDFLLPFWEVCDVD